MHRDGPLAHIAGLQQSSETGDSRSAAPVRSSSTFFVIWLVVVLLALVPGALLRLGLGAELPGGTGRLLALLESQLKDISFGHGLRFWLGVTGASMMALLLLYPLRKMMGLSRLVSISAWFHLHVVLGLVAPALVLYHCNFGLGSRPANVALATTLLVAVSGVLGLFLYTRTSARYYALKAAARASLDSGLGVIDAVEPGPSKDRLIEHLRSFDTRMLEERRGPIRALWSSVKARMVERDAIARVAWLIDTHVAPSQRTELKARSAAHLRRYFSIVRRTERWSVYERAWAMWRLMHLPVFAITILATSIHVTKVWNIDAPAESAAAFDDATGREAAASASAGGAKDDAIAQGRAGAAKPSPFAERSIRTLAVTSETAREAPPVLVEKPAIARRPQRTATEAPAVQTPQPRETRVVAAGTAVSDAGPSEGRAPVAGASVSERALLQQQQRIEPPAPATVPAAAMAERTPLVRPAPPEAPRMAETKPPAPVPPSPAATAVRTVPPAPDPPRHQRAAEADAAVAELARRNETETTGIMEPAALAQKIAQLKAERFDHSKTRFPLAGKHLKVACEKCHTKALRETPRECDTCHKKDDVHRGRRPDCAKCHVPTDWGKIIKRK